MNDSPRGGDQSLRTPDVPLIIDLDGTLIRTDLLQESTLKLVRRQPALVFALPFWLASGKARLKREIAQRTTIDVTILPYDEAVLDWIREERAQGRRLVLCTASDERFARAVAEHLGLFDEVIASDGKTNVSAQRKAAALVGRFGESGFDYAGNAHDDLAVWKHSRRAIIVDAPESVRASAARTTPIERVFDRPRTLLRTWLRAMRLHQWLKNLLVLMPLAGAFQFGNLQLVEQALMAFLAFGLCASSVYVLNDLMDLENDRAHPRKRTRPFASGQLSPIAGVVFAAGSLCASALVASAGRPALMLWLAVYFLSTLAYTFFLKQHAVVDCITLGGLYTLRIIAGCAAVGIPPSFWLLAFSLFLFLSLAFVKRYSELLAAVKMARHDAFGRGYVDSDLPFVQAMGIASGFGSVLLLALYINGDTVLRLYSRPEVLWMTVPIQLCWVSRIWMQAQRGRMHDDPVIFALRDRYSLACGVLFVGALLLAR